MEQTKEFMLLFRFEPAAAAAVDANTQHQQWGSFIGNLAIQEKLVSTYQLGGDGVQLTDAGKVEPGVGLTDKQMLGGNMVVRVKSVDEAIEISRDCPVLTMGGSVEVREIIPIG